jgi:thermostable 8-oxoguanine DNA glycosylase
MIDPSNITNYKLTTTQLEEIILFWICAAGKNGTTAARLLNNLIIDIEADRLGIFNALRLYTTPDAIALELKAHGIGCYTHKARTIFELINTDLDLKTCTAEDLELIYGIGMKTSRCFLIHSRENVQYAGLDTHMLKNLRENGIEGVPKTTPSSKKLYRRLELEVLRLSKEAGLSPAEYDLRVWNTYAVK